jgi:hypothetical protein
MQAYVVHGHTEAGPGRLALAVANLGSARVYRYKLQIKSRVPVERSDRNGVRWTEQPVLWEVQLSADAVDVIGGIGGRVTAAESVAAHVAQTERWANTFNGLAKELGGS